VSKWIVTGGAGFIGANATRALVERGCEVVVIDDLSRPTTTLNLEWLREQLGDRFTFVRADIRDASVIDQIFSAHRDAEVVLHLAAQVAVTTSVAEPRHDLDINVVGTFNVLDATRVRIPDALFINASTNKVFGDLHSHRIEELETRYADLDFPHGVPGDHPTDPHSPYGCSKGSAETYVLDYPRIYGLRTVSFRQSCIYGPRQFGVEDQGWVAWFALGAALGLPLTVYGTGKQVRDLLHVDDLIDLYLRAAQQPDACAGRAYAVGGGPHNTLSVLELLDRLGRPDVLRGEERPGDQKVFVADVSSATADLRWSPSIGLDEGLSGLLEWVELNKRDAARVMPRPDRIRSEA
jgi:CDP-paratose 2-epimerase